MLSGLKDTLMEMELGSLGGIWFQYLKRILALALTLLIIIGGCVQSAWAEEVVPEEIAAEYSLPEEVPEEEYVAEEPAVEEPIVEETPIVEEEPPIAEEKPVEAPVEVPHAEEPVVYDTETGYTLLEICLLYTSRCI